MSVKNITLLKNKFKNVKKYVFSVILFFSYFLRFFFHVFFLALWSK